MTNPTAGSSRLLAILALVFLSREAKGGLPDAGVSPLLDGGYWIIERIDGGISETQVRFHWTGNGCLVGPSAETYFRDGGIDIYDSFGAQFVDCGEVVEPLKFRCDCTLLDAGTRAGQSRLSDAGVRRKR